MIKVFFATLTLIALALFIHLWLNNKPVDPNYDLNRDGTVDMQDASILMANMNEGTR